MQEAIIRLHHVKKSFALQQQELPIVHVPEWEVHAGDRVALLGPSGSGKSTILHLLSGVLKADGGELDVCGRPLHKLGETERDRFRAEHIGYIMQDFHLLASLTARQNVELVLGSSLSARDRKLYIDEWFERVGLSDRMSHLPGQLSRGQQQRVAIVRALVNKPRLVLADEPTGSLDWETAGETMGLLLDLCLKEGLTLVTVTHDLHLAELYPSKVQMTELNSAIRNPQRNAVQTAYQGGIRA